jgi:integrase
MRYCEWLFEWLDNYVQPSVKQHTYEQYRDTVIRRLIPQFGECDLCDLTSNTLQEYVAKLTKGGNMRTGKGLSGNSVNSVINVLKGSLGVASCLGLITESPADKIKRPRTVERRVDCFSLKEQRMIEEYVTLCLEFNPYSKEIGILLALYTGLRIGELLALEWSDIDTSQREITVTKTCYYGKSDDGVYARITDTPKTLSSLRIIPIPKRLIPILSLAKKKSPSTQVVSKGTDPISVRAYQAGFTQMLKELKIKHRGFHSLRHTFATRALECGMDVKALSEILGHRSPTITLNRYAHSMLEHKREMMDRLGRML